MSHAPPSPDRDVDPTWLPILDALASSPLTPLLVEGKTGARVGEALHELTFGRGRAPLVDVDCSWLPEGDANRMLFGDETFPRTHRGFVERADGGTLVLTDVDELPWSEQSRLSHLLDSMRFHRHRGTRPVEVRLRVVASVRGSAEESVLRRRLRGDLHARLGVFRVVAR